MYSLVSTNVATYIYKCRYLSEVSDPNLPNILLRSDPPPPFLFLFSRMLNAVKHPWRHLMIEISISVFACMHAGTPRTCLWSGAIRKKLVSSYAHVVSVCVYSWMLCMYRSGFYICMCVGVCRLVVRYSSCSPLLKTKQII